MVREMSDAGPQLGRLPGAWAASDIDTLCDPCHI
jgi:hypothetical protein